MSFESLFNILLIILGFGLLIGIHELGHFLAAKWSGIRTNAFAVGMGPQVVSFRKGVGFCFKSSSPKVIAKCGKDANGMTDAELVEHGISETEYSLRLLPIGGFVSMLGQEDGKPEEVSADPRSYNMCSIGKRMVVVSAGVVMNLLLAIMFFVICFQIGVNFEAPIVGQIVPGSPAANARSIAHNGGGENNKIVPGDQIEFINGEKVTTFQDVQITSAMAKPGVPILLAITNSADGNLYEYQIIPKNTDGGLLELGLFPDSTLQLRGGESAVSALAMLAVQYPELLQLQPGMKMAGICDPVDYRRNKDIAFQPIAQFNQLESFLSNRLNSVTTLWAYGDKQVVVEIPTQIKLQILRPVGIPENAPQNYEYGFGGLVPLSEISYVVPTSPNVDSLEVGDVITKVNSLDYPRMGQLRNYLAGQPDGDVHVSVLRSGSEVNIIAKLEDGKLGVLLTSALDFPITAQPLEEVLTNVDGALVSTPTPIAGLQILGGSSLLGASASISAELSQNDIVHTAQTWRQFIDQIDTATMNSTATGKLVLIVKNPTKNAEVIQFELPTALGKITGSTSPLAQQLFEPLYVTRHSDGNPLKALQMGFDETTNMVVMTYLTIDRLFRRTVGVDQLRGPVGIVSIGSKIAGRGFSYLLFFLAIISVNLAVLNFLPLPIVDGGLFLYLVYEKIFNKPPPIAFQNAAAALGLCLIGALFLVTFYNDIARLISGAV